MAEYYLQEGNQITLLTSAEGNNNPLNKKHRKHPARRGSQCMGPPQLQDSTSAFAPVTALCFADGNPFAFFFFFLQDTFGHCILINGLSNYIKFKPDLRLQTRRQRGNV